MKFDCCEYLLSEIVFAQSEIIPCCCAPKHEYKTKFFEHYNGEFFNVDEYQKTKKEYIEIFKKGGTPKACEGCYKIREDYWDENPTIKRIIITNRTKCSCNCIYCSLVTTSNQTKQELNTRQAYNIIPILKDLRNKNLINNECEILVAGGECTEYPKGELEEIIYIASLLKCKLEILSSGILYSKAIETALKTQKCSVKISVDSGKKKTFEKIKRVKAYEQVWDNLYKYITASYNNSNSNVIIKYIILPGINDNIGEAKKFIQKCREVNCQNIELAVEYIWLEQNKDKILPTKIKNVVKYIKDSKFNISYEGQCQSYLNIK